MNYIDQSDFVETIRLININPTDGKEIPGFDFNDWDSGPISIRKTEVAAFAYEARNSTRVTLKSSAEFVLAISYQDFKQKML